MLTWPISCCHKVLRHFILTRFNLLLWNKDKGGCPVRTKEWLEHRFALFERYCLPSLIGQRCQDFEWIILFDSKTPDAYKQRIEAYQTRCPQLHPVYVEPENGRFFADIFRREVLNRMKGEGERILTSYLDNDDALNERFVEDLQQRALSLPDGSFINYTDGYQYYTDHSYVMQIHYPRNHFMSVVEDGNLSTVKTIYGFGSHYYIEKMPGVRMETVRNLRMWCEVIHEKNMGNDAYFLRGAKMIRDAELLRREFHLDETVRYGTALYCFRFIPRFFRTFLRRTKYYLFGRHW